MKAETDMIMGLIDLAKSANWILPHEKICWISERHNKVDRDDTGRLHNETCSALEYPDGFAIHAWHGVRVEPYVIEKPKTITVEDILNEKNMEVRRVKVTRMGESKFVRESSAEVADVDVHQYNGTRALFRTKIGTLLHCACPSTARTYFMEVPPEIKTCEEADAYLRGSVNGRLLSAT